MLGYSINESTNFQGRVKYEVKKGTTVEYFYSTEEFISYAKNLL